MAEAIRARLLSAIARAGAGAPRLQFDRQVTVEVDVEVPPNTPANASHTAKMIFDPKVGAVTQHTVPRGYLYRLRDAFIKASADVGVDGVARIKRNLYEDKVLVPPVSTLLVSNPSRPRIAEAWFSEGDIISVEFINIAATGSSAATTKFYLVFDVYKS